MTIKAVAVPVLLIFSPISISATIINIPADYPTIQQGINASIDGDTVLVQPGTYVENIHFNGHNVVLGSLFLTTGDTSYIGQTVIDGNSLNSVIKLINYEDSTAIVNGFNIVNGKGIYTGGGILSVNSSPRICNNIIEYNQAVGSMNSGGGIGLDFSGAIITENTIRHNSATSGGGVSCYRSNAYIYNNYITQNHAWDGAGIFCGSYANIIDNNIIYLNTAEGFGGGVEDNNSSHNIIANNVIQENRVVNTYLSGGGGVFCTGDNTLIANNLIVGNEVYEGGNFGFSHGGGIYGYSSGTGLIIINNTIYNNSAHDGGGGMAVGGMAINNIIWNNTPNQIESNASVIYCNIQGGWPGVGNIDFNPLFRGPYFGDFHLMSTACGDQYDSPCIDAGDPNIFDSTLDCAWGLGAARSDMGAYGGTGDLPDLCQYVTGDANYSGEFDGLDVVYGVVYFTGGQPPPYECECPPGNVWYVAGDVNASCNYNGLDITYAVAYLKGGPAPEPCAECPPSN